MLTHVDISKPVHIWVTEHQALFSNLQEAVVASVLLQPQFLMCHSYQPSAAVFWGWNLPLTFKRLGELWKNVDVCKQIASVTTSEATHLFGRLLLVLHLRVCELTVQFSSLWLCRIQPDCDSADRWHIRKLDLEALWWNIIMIHLVQTVLDQTVSFCICAISSSMLHASCTVLLSFMFCWGLHCRSLEDVFITCHQVRNVEQNAQQTFPSSGVQGLGQTGSESNQTLRTLWTFVHFII